jgi:hypothetical protein
VRGGWFVFERDDSFEFQNVHDRSPQARTPYLGHYSPLPG